MSDDADSGSPDARRFARVEMAFRVKYRSIEDFVVATSHDLSHGGMFIKTERFLPVNAVVRVFVSIPDEEEIPIICRVAYVRDEAAAQSSGKPSGMGLEFLEDVSRYRRLVDRVTAADEPEARRRQRARAARFQVLAVDDDNKARERLARAFTDRGYRVTEARDGVEALAASLKQRPDLVVSDIEMPRLDGWELLRLLRTRPSVATVPFVFVTSQEADEVRLRGYRLGVDDFITKTLSDEELVTRAERVLARVVGPPTMTDKRTLRGDLAHMGLPSVLTLMELERMSGMLLVVGSSIARVYLRQGRPLRIEIDESPVHDATDRRIGDLLSWRAGQFELAASEPACSDELDTTVNALLLQQARLADERARDDEDEVTKLARPPRRDGAS